MKSVVKKILINKRILSGNKSDGWKELVCLLQKCNDAEFVSKKKISTNCFTFLNELSKK